MGMSEIREFHIGDILSITTHRLVSPRGIAGVYDILDYMEGHDHWTHELPSAGDRCAPHLHTQFAWLKDVDASEVTGENWTMWLQARIDEYGEMHAVLPCPRERTQHPIDTLVELLDGKTDSVHVLVLNPADEAVRS